MKNKFPTKKACNRLIVLTAACLLLLSGCGSPGDTDSPRIPVDQRIPVSRADTAQSSHLSSGEESSADAPASRSNSKASSGGSAGGASSASSAPAGEQLTVVKTITPNISSNTKLEYLSGSLNLDTYGLGKIRLTLKNPSQAMSIDVYFTTAEDQNFNSRKSVKITLETGRTASKQYVADLSSCYGFSGKIDKLKITSSSIFDGAMTLEKIELCKGGAKPYPFRIGGKQVIATRAQLKATAGGYSFFPDGLMGVIKKSNGTLDFFGSSPVHNGMQSITIYNGTYDDPIKTLIANGLRIQNVPSGWNANEFNYASIAQIGHIAGSEYFSVIHLEQHYDANGNRAAPQAYYTSSLALGYSGDEGRTWHFCGEIARQVCEAQTGNPKYGMAGNMPPNLNGGKPLSRDVGNGAFLIRDGYVYVYMIDIDRNYSTGFSVLRASLADVSAAARGKSPERKTNLFRKYADGGFTRNGFEAAAFTNIIDSECPANFSSILYSAYLKKYIFVRCSSPMFTSNDGDIVMNISSDPLNFKGNNYYIDAGTRGQQYPTALGIDTAEPGFVCGKEFYIYYCDYESHNPLIWDNANLVRRKITLD